MRRWAALVLVAAAIGMGMAACGGDGESSDATATAEQTTTTGETTTEPETETTETSTAIGREVFLANCGSCHTFSDAGTTGMIGPNLDGIGVSTSEVVDQVTNGGGGMPAFGGQLSDAEIEQVAAYVAGSRGT